MKEFILHIDPGHAWLQVPYTLLRELGIYHKVSKYSYADRHQEFAYLEEDCDLSLFAMAYEKAGHCPTWGLPIVEKHYNNDCFVRNLRPIR